MGQPRSQTQWEVMGYDVRNVLQTFAAAWRSLLWAPGSPVRRRLDEVVLVRDEETTRHYQAGQISNAQAGDCEAILLPEHLVLTRELHLPLAAEVALDSALLLEVAAHSPFPTDDTAYGWRINARDAEQLQVSLAIVSASAVRAYLAKQHVVDSATQLEVWASADNQILVLQGFGEGKRNLRYRQRLLRVGAMLSVAAALALLLLAANAYFQRAQLLHYQDMVTELSARSSAASALRTELLTANETIQAAAAVLGRHPNPHLELARLTEVLDDTSSVERFAMQGTAVEIRGRAADAAAVMQTLSNQPEFVEVTAPRAISRARNSQEDFFHLNIRLRDGVEP